MQFPIHKVIITGTGRSGTTFLVRLLTEFGLDTGFTRRTWRRDYFAHCNAGLERDPLLPGAPYIVKSPQLCETLPSILATGRFVIDRAIIPMRDLEAAALSRARVGGAEGSVPGGLWRTADPNAQKAVLGELFHRLVLTLVEHDIPFTLLVFPRMVEDADYAYDKLQFLVGHIPRERFRRGFARVADPKLVHRFPDRAIVPAPMLPAGAFEAEDRRLRIRRRLRLVYARTGVAVALLLLGFGVWRFHARIASFAVTQAMVFMRPGPADAPLGARKANLGPAAAVGNRS